MYGNEVPRSMREARSEVLLALASSSEMYGNVHCKRAAGLLVEAVDEIRKHPAAAYDWSLLRKHRNLPEPPMPENAPDQNGMSSSRSS